MVGNALNPSNAPFNLSTTFNGFAYFHADQIHAVSDTYRANIAVQTHWHFRCQSLKTDRPSIQAIVAPIQHYPQFMKWFQTLPHFSGLIEIFVFIS